MPTAKAAPVKKKKKLHRPQEEYCTYLIEITDFNVRYSFSLNRGKRWNPGPYSEYSAIQIIGKLHEPAKILGREIKCTIYGSREHDRKLNEPEKYDGENDSLVGYVTAGKDYCGFTSWVPSSIIFGIGQMIQTKEFQFLELHGKPLFRNEANIHDITFTKEPEE